jgi:hypothetical protein
VLSLSRVAFAFIYQPIISARDFPYSDCSFSTSVPKVMHLRTNCVSLSSVTFSHLPHISQVISSKAQQYSKKHATSHESVRLRWTSIYSVCTLQRAICATRDWRFSDEVATSSQEKPKALQSTHHPRISPVLGSDILTLPGAYFPGPHARLQCLASV